MSRSEEFGAGTSHEVSWDHVVTANTGPFGKWNGSDDGEVEEAVAQHTGHEPHEARWSRERVPIAALGGRNVVDEYAKPCSCGNHVDCPSCYSKAAAKAGPPVPLVQDKKGELHAPDGRHRIAGAVARGQTHIDAFIARAR